MEMKKYQKQVIADLIRYLELLNETQDYRSAFSFFWQEKSAPSLGHYGELSAYVDLIVDGMNKEQLAALEKAPRGFAMKIKDKIDSLLTQHFKETFKKWLDTEKIVCQPFYKLPAVIHPTSDMDMIGSSLYRAEENMNQLEMDLVMELTALLNVRWWHRNIARQGFCINGFINHYPDIMVMTQSGKITMVETKGEHLKMMTAEIR